MSESYKKQLDTAKIELEILRNMNDAYENQIYENKFEIEKKSLEETVVEL